jgi:serine/threonine protein kinase
MIGQTLDKRYKIIRKLGSGGFGEAFLAKDISLHGIFCVVKQLKPIDKSEQFLKIARRLFRTESATLLRLGKHDQIPTLLAHLEKEKDFFLVQEFVDGHPLSAEIKANQPWAIDDVVDLLASVLEPLAFAHTNNVIHRDIKPDNLMRRHSDGKVVLIDFGAVKEVINSSSIAQGQAVFTVGIGTPGYMPVEQANGKPKFSSDIYALGITCIQALTGLSEQELDPNSWRHLINIDESLADILDLMVHYDFNHRYPSGSEALAAVQGYMKENPRTSPKVPYLPPPELVNNHSYASVTDPTRKISIARTINSVFRLSKSTTFLINLWLEIFFSYVTTGLVFYFAFIFLFISLYFFSLLSGGFSLEEMLDRLISLRVLMNGRILMFLLQIISWSAVMLLKLDYLLSPSRSKRFANTIIMFPSWRISTVYLSSTFSVWVDPIMILPYVIMQYIFALEECDYFIKRSELKAVINQNYEEWIKEIEVNKLPEKYFYRNTYVFLSIAASIFVSVLANIISWGIASKIIGEKVLTGIVFLKGNLMEQVLVLVQPLSQVIIYAIMISAAMVVMFIKFPESEKTKT